MRLDGRPVGARSGSARACAGRCQKSARRRRLIGVLAPAICVLLLAFAASARAAEALGAIEGHVTEAASHTPVPGIDVIAITTNFELLGEEEHEYENLFGEAMTGSRGEYEISELRPGTYYVGFFAPLISPLNYVPQLYDGKSGISEATQVTVAAEKTTPEIGAELSPGGEIAGTVTSASTGAPVAQALACALLSGPNGLEDSRCAVTEEGGAYTIRGLPTGSYKLGFAGRGLEVQYYKDKASEAEAELISVTAGQLISGFDAAMTAAAPSPSTPPGSTLSTEVTPTSKLSGGAISKKPPSAPETTLSLLGKRITVASNGYAVVRLACTGTISCGAKLTLDVHELVKVKGRKVLRTVTIGKSAILSIAAGKRLTVMIKLDPAARRLLKADHGRLHVQLALKTLAGEGDDSVVLVAR